MKQEVVKLKDRIAGGIKVRLDALSPEQRMHVVIGMFCILVLADGDGHCRQQAGRYDHRDRAY